MTTDIAFQKLLDSEYLWMTTGETKAKRRWYKHRFVKGELSEEKKNELLKKAGFHIAVERQWGHSNLA